MNAEEAAIAQDHEFLEECWQRAAYRDPGPLDGRAAYQLLRLTGASHARAELIMSETKEFTRAWAEPYLNRAADQLERRTARAAGSEDLYLLPRIERARHLERPRVSADVEYARGYLQHTLGVFLQDDQARNFWRWYSRERAQASGVAPPNDHEEPWGGADRVEVVRMFERWLRDNLGQPYADLLEAARDAEEDR